MKVNKDNKGIADIFVFFRKKPDKIHPDLLKPKEEEVVLDQKGCIFKPHAFVLRTDQQLIVKNDDSIPHNTHGGGIYNPGYNVTIGANDREGVKIEQSKANIRPDIVPYLVKCDIHPHMSAFCCVVDHPYAAVTDKDGKFKIEKLPEGTHQIQVWHSRVGWIEKAWEIEVKAGEMSTIDPVNVAVDRFVKD